jgi:hypothetical protein
VSGDEAPRDDWSVADPDGTYKNRLNGYDEAEQHANLTGGKVRHDLLWSATSVERVEGGPDRDRAAAVLSKDDADVPF